MFTSADSEPADNIYVLLDHPKYARRESNPKITLTESVNICIGIEL